MFHALFIDEMADAAIALIENDLPSFYYYVIGHQKPAFVASVGRLEAAAVPVFIDQCSETLLVERSQSVSSSPMGYVKNVFESDWARGLPSAPFFIANSFCLSGREDAFKQQFLADAYERLREGGYLFWADTFLPQRLSYLSSYQDELLRLLTKKKLQPAPTLDAVKQEYLTSHASSCLLERAVDFLYDAGFGNVEISYKRLNFALLAARK